MRGRPFSFPIGDKANGFIKSEAPGTTEFRPHTLGGNRGHDWNGYCSRVRVRYRHPSRERTIVGGGSTIVHCHTYRHYTH